VEAGQRVGFDIDASNGARRPLRSNLDSFLILWDADGRRQIAQNDDCDGLDSALGFEFEEAGRYYIEVASCCVGDGGPNGLYSLYLSDELPECGWDEGGGFDGGPIPMPPDMD
jgi:hypothetical protein